MVFKPPAMPVIFPSDSSSWESAGRRFAPYTAHQNKHLNFNLSASKASGGLAGDRREGTILGTKMRCASRSISVMGLSPVSTRKDHIFQ